MSGRRLDPRREDPDSSPEVEHTPLPSEVVVVKEPIEAKRSSRPEELSPGALLGGHYRVVRRLGGGAMGQVYEAINTWTTRRVAVKLLREDMAHDASIARRFLIEAQAATRAAHPNIVEILDMGKDPESGRLYLVQDFLEGIDLHDHLKLKGRLSVLEARTVLVPVMEALATAHDKGVLHRDLKPENIFLVKTPDGHTVPKVIDFGLARSEATAGDRVTGAGSIIGTAFYMSPEQARGESTVDARSDIWAVGVLWYEVLTGKTPFDGENLQQVLHKIFAADAAPIDSLAPEVSSPLAAAIARAMRRATHERYPTMWDFLDTLLPLLPEEPVAPSGLRSSRPARNLRPPLALASPLPSHVTPVPEFFPPSPPVPALSSPPPLRLSNSDVVADDRRVRTLSALLGFALLALVLVAGVALDALDDVTANGTQLRGAPGSVRMRRFRERAVAGVDAGVVSDASFDAGGADVTSRDVDETAQTHDAGNASDTVQPEEDAHARRHRSRHHRDRAQADGEDGERRRHRTRHRRNEE